MPIDRKEKYIFIHIPKVAGTSIEKALGIYGDNFQLSKNKAFGKFKTKTGTFALQHVSLRQLIHFEIISPNEAHDYFSFSFVRNPWDRAVSDFKWQKSLRKQKYSFREYLKKCRQETLENKHSRLITYNNCHYIPQSWYLFDKNGFKQVNFIGKYETLETDFEKVRQRIKILHANLSTHNKGKAVPYFFYYFDFRNIFLVKQIYKEDIKRFNYHFFKSNALKLFLKKIKKRLFKTS